jgi:hypothetical protein
MSKAATRITAGLDVQEIEEPAFGLLIASLDPAAGEALSRLLQESDHGPVWSARVPTPPHNAILVEVRRDKVQTRVYDLYDASEHETFTVLQISNEVLGEYGWALIYAHHGNRYYLFTITRIENRPVSQAGC